MENYTKEEIQIIRKLLRSTKNPVMYRKYLVIRLHMKGLSNKYITELVDLDPKTVSSYIAQYVIYGVNGLIPKKSPGRPSYLTKAQERQVYLTISEKTPEEGGFEGIRNWTAKIACLWVYQEFGIQYKINGMLDLFHRLNLSYTRPTYVLDKAEPEKQEQFKADFDDVKKNF